MVSFKKALPPEQVESIRAYLVSRAIDLKNNPPRNPNGAGAELTAAAALSVVTVLSEE